MRAGYQGRRYGMALLFGLMWLRTAAGAGEGDTELLRRQVGYLTEALAKSKAEADGLRARLERRAGEETAGDGGQQPAGRAVVRGREYRILDVNKELGMVVLDGGRQDGVRPGLRFAVIEKDRAVATVRVVDVRAAVAGAVVQNADRAFPKVQDRAVVVTGSGD